MESSFIEIGVFKSAHDGYAGKIQFIGQKAVAIAFLPIEESDTFIVLLAAKSEETSLKIGHAKAHAKKLSVTLDSPLLAMPIQAEMSLNANSEGLYILKWKRLGHL